jgi:hypothetical protein
MAVKSGSSTTMALASGAAQNTKEAAKGRPFAKGRSGNPGGRPKVPESVREACRALTSDAIETLKSVMADPQSPPNARVAAANAVLDRAWGRPTTESELRIGGIAGAPAIPTAAVDLSKLSPEHAYQFLIQGGQLPTVRDGAES